ncbi:MAG TPA: GNAT family N-acetyltransferase [Pyrinomonadaceae bacterium]|jgi:predicted N-acetyltransferase YhbS|nr:GNAT family N-acetyltransferase [Pyrinomonadaceae bacterium]
MTASIRSMNEEDVETCGQICFEAFKGIADKHNYRWDFSTPEQATQLMLSMFSSPEVFNVVAESGGRLIGSNHLSEYNEIRAVGPITVDPAVQAKGVGRMLMQAVIDRAQGARGIRLVQDAFNTASLSLYSC